LKQHITTHNANIALDMGVEPSQFGEAKSSQVDFTWRHPPAIEFWRKSDFKSI